MSDSRRSLNAALNRLYESVIKVEIHDPPEKRAQEIAEGIGYACALLHDEYGWSSERIRIVLEDHAEEVDFLDAR